MNSNIRAIRWTDLFEGTNKAYPVDGSVFDGKWCVSQSGVYHIVAFVWSASQHEPTRKIVTTACNDELQYPMVLKTTDVNVSAGLAETMLKNPERMCRRCAKHNTVRAAELEKFLTSLRNTVIEEKASRDERREQTYERLRFRDSMDNLIENGIIEALDTPLKELDFGDLTLRQLITATEDGRWQHRHLSEYNLPRVPGLHMGALAMADDFNKED